MADEKTEPVTDAEATRIAEDVLRGDGDIDAARIAADILKEAKP